MMELEIYVELKKAGSGSGFKSRPEALLGDDNARQVSLWSGGQSSRSTADVETLHNGREEKKHVMPSECLSRT